MTRLAVFLDGEALSDDQGAAMWKRFSGWMETHRGDLAGFARGEGLASVHPEMQGGTPVLVASRTDPQRRYTVAPVADAVRPARPGPASNTPLASEGARRGVSKR